MPRADATLRGSNRPISLLSPIGKLLKHFLLRLINRIFQERRILKDCKFGDRAKHSTTHCLGAFTTYVTDDFKFKMEIIAISLDFPKVFDTIWQHAIFFQILSYGFDWQTCRMVTSFLQYRVIRVRVNNKLSEQWLVKAGVSQRLLLGPVFYNMLVRDIPGPPGGGLLRGHFGKRAERRLNAYMNTLHHYVKKSRLNLNDGKCVYGL